MNCKNKIIKEIEDKIEELKEKVCKLREEENEEEKEFDYACTKIREILEKHCDFPLSQTHSVHEVKKGCKFGDYGQRYTVDLTPGSWIPEIQQLDRSLKCAGFKLSYISQTHDVDCGKNPMLYLLVDTKNVEDNTRTRYR